MHKLFFIFIPLLLLVVYFSSCNQSNKTASNKLYLEGEVIKIIDGDTYYMVCDNETIRVKMEGIDAPEKGMPFYAESKKYLKELCYGRIVQFKPNGLFKYDKQVGFTYLGKDFELSHEMLRAGMAWHNKKLNSDNELYKLETQARLAKRGLWATGTTIPPRNMRKIERNGVPRKYQNISCFPHDIF